jgi:tryptophan synthase beta subunit
MQIAKERPVSQKIIVCLSGRGDKDTAEIARLRGESAD